MKKTIIIMLALFLALPALSFAGSATSRWDMTIGGYVKFDMGYNTQSLGNDPAVALPSGYGAYGNVSDKYGSFFMYSGETRLNFLVRGPDAWGAKTSAFVEGHFRGNEYNNASGSQGTFGLRHAFMQFDWPTSKLVIGQTWQTWGLLPTFANQLLDYNALGPFLKGMRQPLVRFEQTFAKDFTWKVGIISPTNSLGSSVNGYTLAPNAPSAGQNVDSYTRSQMPYFEGSFGWSSDKCGSIGPWKMLFALEGFYGRQKQISTLNTIATGTGQYSAWFNEQNVDSWGIAFKGFIPIIPEKKGNKAGALSVSGNMYYTQNPGMFQSPTSGAIGANTNGSYDNATYTMTNTGAAAGQSTLVLTQAQLVALDYAAPTQYGGWGQLSYFFTDKLFVNGWYGYTRTNTSTAFNSYQAGGAGTAYTNAGDVVNTQEIIANIMYDVNAAIRFGFEYAWFNTRYANYGVASVNGSNQIVAAKDGTAQSFRVGAFYFF